MYSEKKNDRLVMDAIRLQNNNQHYQAAELFQRAGNQYRDPKEKAELWKAAEKARKTHYSD